MSALIQLLLSWSTGDIPRDTCYGIKELASGTSPVVDIVAIHGLDGDREGSWTATNGVLWLRDLLPSIIPEARILTYGYDANTRNQPRFSTDTVYDHGLNLIVKLVLFRNETETKERPIIFVAHSVGGIVLKSALIHANATHSRHLHEHKAIELSTYGIIFLGTPHQGAKTADFGGCILDIISIHSKTNKIVVKQLRPHSEQLQVQLPQYNAISEKYDTKFFYEALPTYLHNGTRVVVPKHSAVVPGAVNAEPISLQKDHTNLVRFLSAYDEDFRTVSQVLSQMAKKSPAIISRCWRRYKRTDDPEDHTPPYVPTAISSPIFTGQQKYLEQLREYFGTEGRRSDERRHHLIHGMGGIGKTQICLKFAEECVKAKRFWRIFWVDTTSPETLKIGFEAIANDPVARNAGVEKTPESVLRWLSSVIEEWLLILDNADDQADELSRILPLASQGNILITSRNAALSKQVQKVTSIDVMEKPEAVQLLSKAADIQDAVEKEDPGQVISNSIVENLGSLPLAVDIAGAVIRNNVCTIREYPEIFARHRRSILNGDAAGHLYNFTVYTALDISRAGIEIRADRANKPSEIQLYKDAIFILRTLPFFHHQRISEDTFKRAAEAPPWPRIVEDTDDPQGDMLPTTADLPIHLLKRTEAGIWDPFSFRKAMSVLCQFSVLKKDMDQVYSWTMHPLVHCWARDMMSPEDHKLFSSVTKALLCASVTWRFTPEDYLFRKMLLPHIKAYYQHTVEARIQPRFQDDECAKFGLVLSENGYWKDTEALQRKALKIRGRVLGGEHPDTLISKYNLAMILGSMGELQKAEEIGKEVVEAQKDIMGDEALETLQSMANLAVTYLAQKRLEEAESLQAQVVQARTRIRGPNHPETLVSMYNLSSTLRQQGRLEDAEKLGIQVLKARKAVFGEDDPATLTSMAGLAATFRDQGRLEEAAEMQSKVVQLRKDRLGLEHLSTLRSMHFLALILQQQGKLQDAMSVGLGAVQGLKKAAGAENEHTVGMMEVLMDIFQAEGNSAEVENLKAELEEIKNHQRSDAKWHKSLGITSLLL
ncbi:hypothetical protein BU17DRAFT_94396 [Hysterangium stoloniferum]|nr:hypothetical protein BU17DRAFT_94396 [Hysterangium stoloniferum]